MKLFYIILMSMFSVACTLKQNNSSHNSHQRPYSQKQDSAPSGPIPRFFKDILLKSEPLSRYGNPDSYYVNGKKYKVMPSARGYRQRGLASWYGTKFHSHRTSSGENYNMYALTAAHKTLPLPTYIKVKNLNNGKTAIIKVNDRGPFHTNRIIDLSYGAAVKLGIFPKGTALVEIEAITLKEDSKRKPASYYLQAGAFSTSRFAFELKNKLQHYTKLPINVEHYDYKYIVRVGPISSRQIATQLKDNLSRKGFKGAFTVLL